MIKRLLVGACLCFAALGNAYAIDVNSASPEALKSIKGIGPAIADMILKEREQNGRFADSADLAKRVRGIGDKSVVHYVEGGLTFD